MERGKACCLVGYVNQEQSMFVLVLSWQSCSKLLQLTWGALYNLSFISGWSSRHKLIIPLSLHPACDQRVYRSVNRAPCAGIERARRENAELTMYLSVSMVTFFNLWFYYLAQKYLQWIVKYMRRHRRIHDGEHGERERASYVSIRSIVCLF